MTNSNYSRTPVSNINRKHVIFYFGSESKHFNSSALAMDSNENERHLTSVYRPQRL